MFNPRGLNRMLARHGQEITLRKNVQGTYDPITGTITTTPTDYTVLAYFYDFSEDAFSGDNIQVGDRKCVIKQTLTNGNNTPMPDADDYLIDTNGNTLKVVTPSVIQSANKAMCYLVHVRK